MTDLGLDHVVTLSSHSQDKVEDIYLSFFLHHLGHGLDGDEGPCTTHSGTTRVTVCVFVRVGEESETSDSRPSEITYMLGHSIINLSTVDNYCWELKILF